MRILVATSLVLATTAMAAPPPDARAILWPGLFRPALDAATHAPASHSAPADETASCRCAEQRIRNGWCTRCDVGHVAGVPIRSRTLFDFLDAHGHRIDPDRLECAECRVAVRNDRMCSECKWGFVDGLLYFTELTYRLARGTPLAAEDRPCRRLRPATPAAVWCGGCAIGVVGNAVYTSHGDFASAAREFARLKDAVATSSRCELCAVVLFTGAECPRCGPDRVDAETP
ncbi:MAG: hypothetical protein HKO59_06015 [Phycisphaerales bacterium]|nr:hypothetical protein [Phycisphaerales bacterium]NNM25528.1 hypothetical protein [Phycisphaerales bacterium]